MSARVMARDQSLTPSTYCCGDAEISGQLPCAQRLVLAFPRHAGRALGAGVAELQRDLRVGVGVHEVDDALPAVALRLVPQARAARA